ncbi:DEAD/DEAH box helicase [Terribacillus saccharophilus]|uniref:DEAD/DEAH box helicase n=1 Tax=Terribacillus saccharophilus TaxID=361277 RepID=UPI0006919789|nr:AAA domain-containing protein [Terribacillus goriensis]
MKVSNILKALWHIETLAPGEVPATGTISRKFTNLKIKNIHKLEHLRSDSLPKEWSKSNLTLKSSSMKPHYGFYGYCFREHQLIQFQRDNYNVKDEIHNKSMKNCFGFYANFDESKKYIKDSLFIPHLMLYINLFLNNKSPFKDNFFDSYKEACTYLEDQAASINGGVLSPEWLEAFTREFNTMFAIPPNAEKNQHYMELTIVDRKSEQKDKFNSFYSEDILRAIQDKSTTVEQFFRRPKRKIDINENREFIEESLHPLNTPLGRWPSNIAHRASLMQQVAINEFFRSDTRISSVNGPPGTGKTTLLKDIFAEIVVRKAIALVAFRKKPDKALIDSGTKVTIKNRFRFKGSDGETVSRIVYDIDPSIAAHAAVVASSNNTAVENISKDLPKEKEIHSDFIEEMQPLKYARAISKEIAGDESWGMFSIPLGKGENIKNASNLLTHEKFSFMNSLTKSGGKNENRIKEWEKACDDFNQTYKEVQKLRKSLAKSADKYYKYPIEKNQEFINSTDDYWEIANYESRQQNVLFQTNELNTLRSRLFIKALIVLRHFLSVNHAKIEAALSLLNENRNEIDINNEKGIAAMKAMWNTIHCICPVISTTFASFASMYRGMPKDFIPNLFIDEAGQATPAQAVGAIWRSRRVMAVGDPLQIEPVQSIEASLLEDICGYNKVESDVLNIKSSVQSLADRSNPLGTFINEESWIGVPLWVHRRCINPMFSIANKLAYNGKMVLAKDQQSKTNGIGKWLNTQGSVTAKQYVPEQTEALKRTIKESMASYLRKKLLDSIKAKLDDKSQMKPLLEGILKEQRMDRNWETPKQQSFDLMHKYFELKNGRNKTQLLEEIDDYIKGDYSYPSVFVITPFSIVKNEIKKEIVPGLFENMKNWLGVNLRNNIGYTSEFNFNDMLKTEIEEFETFYKDWVQNNIGTVHTFQGKEADIVYFITGTDATTLSAAEWACKEPNLLNVAVTRAKKEFYLIGDQNLLERFNNYKTIIKEIEEHETETLYL